MKTSQVTAQLEELFRAGTHAHAYLFYGTSVVDKKEAALKCARIAIGIENEGARVNPDLLLVSVAEGEQGISIEEIRGIRQFLSLEPYFGRQRVVIIEQFEKMKTEASSALLKILEEPPRKSTLILLSDSPHLILDTIVSRVQRIDFSGTHHTQGIDKLEKVCNTLSAVILANRAHRFTLIEKMSKQEEDSDLLDHWVLFFHDMLHIALYDVKDALHYPFYREQYKKLIKSAQYTPARIASILPRLIEYAHAAKTTNANKRLIMENISLLL